MVRRSVRSGASALVLSLAISVALAIDGEEVPDRGHSRPPKARRWRRGWRQAIAGAGRGTRLQPAGGGGDAYGATASARGAREVLLINSTAAAKETRATFSPVTGQKKLCRRAGHRWKLDLRGSASEAHPKRPKPFRDARSGLQRRSGRLSPSSSQSPPTSRSRKQSSTAASPRTQPRREPRQCRRQISGRGWRVD